MVQQRLSLATGVALALSSFLVAAPGSAGTVTSGQLAFEIVGPTSFPAQPIGGGTNVSGSAISPALVNLDGGTGFNG